MHKIATDLRTAAVGNKAARLMKEAADLLDDSANTIVKPEKAAKKKSAKKK